MANLTWLNAVHICRAGNRHDTEAHKQDFYEILAEFGLSCLRSHLQLAKVLTLDKANKKSVGSFLLLSRMSVHACASTPAAVAAGNNRAAAARGCEIQAETCPCSCSGGSSPGCEVPRLILGWLGGVAPLHGTVRISSLVPGSPGWGCGGGCATL